MLDDSFCCLRSLIIGTKIGIEFPKVPWMPANLSGSVVWWWSYMHTNVYAVYHHLGSFIFCIFILLYIPNIAPVYLIRLRIMPLNFFILFDNTFQVTDIIVK